MNRADNPVFIDHDNGMGICPSRYGMYMTEAIIEILEYTELGLNKK